MTEAFWEKTVQVDWVSGEVSSQRMLAEGVRPYDTGLVAVLAPDGEVKPLRANFLNFEGSHDNRIALCSRDGASVYVSGNPVKFFQGHNLFGSINLDGLFLSAGVAIRKGIGMFPGPETFQACQYEAPRYTRVDLTRSYRFPSDGAARAWLREVGANARTRHGAGLFVQGSVIFGKGSRRWSFTIYPKFDELAARGRGHALSKQLHDEAAKRLTEWASGVVRFELRLRAPELHNVGAITNALATWSQYYERIQFNRNASAGEADMISQALPQHLRGYFARWKTGEDLRRGLARNTFYRVRRELLSQLGVDIASPPPLEAPTQAAVGLDPVGWDPEPIEQYLFEPGDELRKQYGLV